VFLKLFKLVSQISSADHEERLRKLTDRLEERTQAFIQEKANYEAQEKQIQKKFEEKAAAYQKKILEHKKRVQKLELSTSERRRNVESAELELKKVEKVNEQESKQQEEMQLLELHFKLQIQEAESDFLLTECKTKYDKQYNEMKMEFEAKKASESTLENVLQAGYKELESAYEARIESLRKEIDERKKRLEKNAAKHKDQLEKWRLQQKKENEVLPNFYEETLHELRHRCKKDTNNTFVNGYDVLKLYSDLREQLNGLGKLLGLDPLPENATIKDYNDRFSDLIIRLQIHMNATNLKRKAPDDFSQPEEKKNKPVPKQSDADNSTPTDKPTEIADPKDPKNPASS